MVVHSTLQDCHLYIIKRWVIDYVIADKYIDALHLINILHLLHLHQEHLDHQGGAGADVGGETV